MDKKTFHKKWYYKLLLFVYWISLILIIGTLVVFSFYEDDIPIAGLFWVIVAAFLYWVIKKILYYIMFKERFL